MIPHSIDLIITGSSLIASTHAASHGAGQIRPVNSGKLLVACRRSIASRHSPRRTRSFHSGIRLPSGQPWWQNGIPQSMQRRPCSRSPSAGQRAEDLVVVGGARARVALRRRDALDLEEAARIGHQAASASGRRERSSARLVVVRDDLHERRRRRSGRARWPPPASRCARGARAAARRRSARPRRRAPRARRASGCSARRTSPSPSSTYAIPPLMPAAKLRPVGPSTTHVPAGHVLAAVVADALDDRVGAGVAHREALARQPAEERAARRRAVERRVARDHVLVGARPRASVSGRTAITPPDSPLPA